MPGYRFGLYAADERLTGEQHQWFSNDDAAVTFARVLLADHPAIEVWQNRRLVQRVTRPGSSEKPSPPWHDV
jgi:hypothetical protein